MDLDKKYEKLKKFVEEKGKEGVVIAFSGGVDSSTLAAVCYNLLGEKAVAVTAKSPTYPSSEIKEAKRIAKEIGIKHYLIETNELSNENFVKNPENRCYYCKKELLDSLQNFARKIGFKVVFEGTNFSDLNGHRPGFKALKERKNVFSPWVENKFSKKEIRELAKKLGLSVHDKPSLACLASRIPFNQKITKERLKRIEKAEQLIKKITRIRQVRVRDHGDLARIEVGKDERNLFFNIQLMDKIAKELKRLGFNFITLDLEGYRTGSMVATIKNERKKR
ncbi:MAG: ATP-dependent sacrificial sulfur transferase LarE [Candidatus Aenigmatarchaeota archaeon]